VTRAADSRRYPAARRNPLAHEPSARPASLNPVENEKLLTAAREALFELGNYWTYFDIGRDPEFVTLEPDWTTVCGEELMLSDRVIEEARYLRRIAAEHDA